MEFSLSWAETANELNRAKTLTERKFVVRETGIPDLAGMMLAVVEALREIGSSAHIHELDEKVIEREGLKEEEQSYPMSGNDPRLRVNYYLAWARTYLRRGGALENSARGIWSLTKSGSEITTKAQTKAIFDQVVEEEKQRAKARRENSKTSDERLADQTNVTDIATTALDDTAQWGERSWTERLLAVVGSLTPDAFERLSQRLLREAGFTKVEVRGKSGDGGIDGVGVLRVNLVSFQVYFQCKKWKGSVGSKEIRDFRGALQGRADKGLFITTGTFTSHAADEATRDGAIAIDLIDGMRLCELLKENALGISTKMVEEIEIDEAWYGRV